MRYGWRAAVLAWGMMAGIAVAEAPSPRLNDLQFIGTHNSYHVEPDVALFDLMRATGYAESADWPAKKLVPALSYSHPDLGVQLDMGLRVFELDVHDDPDGGRYADPGFLKVLPPEIVAGLAPVDPLGELHMPGMKVFHAADTDVRSRCLRFTRCLEIIRDWSAAHPGHLPIFIQIETKEGRKPAVANGYTPAAAAPFTAQAWGRLHAEIAAVFAPSQIVRPAEVQRGYASVNAAVRAEGWPEVERLRGRVIFLLLDDPDKQDAYAAFTVSEPPLLFLSRTPEDPATAWLIRPKPKAHVIMPLVRQGFLVYTRADADREVSDQAMDERRRAALASGAQLIATDYPRPDPRHGAYQVSFGKRYARCNPLVRDRCQADDVQEALKKRE